MPYFPEENKDATCLLTCYTLYFFFNPLPDMPILHSSSSTANTDLMSKKWTNGETDI